MAREAKKIVSGSNITAQEAEEILAQYAAADAELEKRNATMDLEITRIRQKYQDKIAQLLEQKALAFEKLQAYAQDNRDVFGNKKSLSMTHGAIGFRTGNPALKTLKGFTWNSVLTLIKKIAPDYVRNKEEVDKETLLASRDKSEVKALMSEIGVQVVQEESFFVEPKKEAELA